jgi:hypothetical protein
MRILGALLILATAVLIALAFDEAVEELLVVGVLVAAGGVALLFRRSKGKGDAGPTTAELAQRIQQLEERLAAAEEELGLLTPEIQRLRDEREFLRALYAGVSEKSRA